MFKMLTKNKKGFTIVELLMVLVLLSFGVFALGNMIRVTYRAFDKSEERAIKQEAVKTVAEALRSGQTNVASALSADIFNTTDIISPTQADSAYSYLYFDPHYACSKCEKDWNSDQNKCSAGCSDGTSKVDGYFIKCLNKGVLKDAAIQLSDIPMYVRFDPIKEFPKGLSEEELQNANNKVNQCGVIITLAALEADYDYSGGAPKSDDIYYSLDVTYHFPNMVLSENGCVVNYATRALAAAGNTATNAGNEEKRQECCNHATSYNSSGNKNGTVPAVDVGGTVLRVYSDAIISGDNANAVMSVPSLCFIATASYGNDSGEVGLLCEFRDKCLLTNPVGSAFVDAYYAISPPIADFIRESEPLKAVVRVALKPLVAVATNVLDGEAASQSAAWFAIFMLCGVASSAMLVHINKRNKREKRAKNK